MLVRVWVRVGLLATVAALLGACKGPAGPALSGTIQGFVYLHDEYGAPLVADSDMTVTLVPTASTITTGPSGYYDFLSIPTGVYSLRFNETAFGTYFIPNIQFLGGGTVEIPGANLGKASLGVITNLAFTANAAGDTIIATGNITAPPAGIARYVRLFFDAQASVVGTNPASWTVTLPASGPPYAVTGSTFAIVITGIDLRTLQHAFSTGATVNAIGYGESYYENSYPDTINNTGKPIFPNLCAVASNVTTFPMVPSPF